MIINRYNYEEYFILYMDNELGSDGRRQVEAFVQKNPDLKEELDILLQYKLVPDADIVFAGKEELMIPIPIGTTGDSPVNPANYEEWLVLYIDNELTIEEQIAVEQFVSSHPSAKKELTLLQRTKLQPEAIHFAHKESLHRREEKVRPLPFRWWRVAAAAVLILTVGLTAVIVLNKRSAVKPDLVKIQGNEQKVKTPDPVIMVKEENTPVTTPVIADSRKQDLPPSSKQAGNSTAVKNNTLNEKPANKIHAPVKKEELVVVDNNNKPSNNLPKPVNNSNLNNNVPKNDVANAPKEKIRPSNSLTNNDVTTDLTAPLYAMSTTSDDVVDLNQSEKKGKLRGFLRKVTRTFEKRTNIDATDDDKLLVGGLAFKLK